MTGRDAYFKLNKADNGAYVRGGVVIGDGYFDNRIRVAEGSLVIGSDVASTSGKEFVIDEMPSGVFAADGLALVSAGGRNGMVGFDFRERRWVSSGETGLMKDVCDYVNEDLEEHEEELDESGLGARLGFRLLSGQLANFISGLDALGFDQDLRLRGRR